MATPNRPAIEEMKKYYTLMLRSPHYSLTSEFVDQLDEELGRLRRQVENGSTNRALAELTTIETRIQAIREVMAVHGEDTTLNPRGR